MLKSTAVVSACLVGGLAFAAGPPAPAEYGQLLDKYCVSCHNNIDNLPAGHPLYLDEVSLDNLGADLEIWEKVLRKINVGSMPPQDKPHPGIDKMEGFRAWLGNSLDGIALAKNDPGKFTIHRLNRTEYSNAIRDLFGLEVDVVGLLPPDAADFGFDNIASALQVTPALLDRYLTASMRISTVVVGDPQAEAQEAKFPLRIDYNQGSHIDGLPIGTRGGTAVTYNFPADGEYVLSAALYRPVDSADKGMEGRSSPDEFQILIDGVIVHSGLIGGPEDHAASRKNLTAARESAAERMKVRTPVKAGPHEVVFTFVDRPARSQDIFQPALRGSQDIHVGAGLPTLNNAVIVGPFNTSGVSDSSVRNRLYVCRPKSQADESACAKEILSTLAKRAYRRPVTDQDLQPLMKFYAQGREGGNFDDGLRSALPRLLTSPAFLFRTERDPDNLPVGAPHLVSDIELASRLSFFLWSSIPDDELLNLAIKGKLRSKGVLEQQVRRMLADDRAMALTTNFPDQWLALRNLGLVVPDLLLFPSWDLTLNNSLQQETRLFFDSVVRENRSAMDLLNADYTFVNERVARHYGIPDIYGPAFRRVKLTDPNRRGILGQGSILALTSVATRTSPVFRGKWVLTNLLNTPPLPPPPNVPALAENTVAVAPKSVRERLETHRADAVCSSCHRGMDPIGFALENFDATGQWRSKTEDGRPVDASGVLVDGTAMNSPSELREALARRPYVFVGTVTEKMLTYALGRGLEPNDMQVVREIVRESAKDDYRFMTIIMGIVESRPFQMRAKIAASDTVTAQTASAKTDPRPVRAPP